jgi:AcrR family transcriptional regulator
VLKDFVKSSRLKRNSCSETNATGGGRWREAQGRGSVLKGTNTLNRSEKAAAKKPDRRRKKTREAVFRAFKSLLSRREYGRISVQDIIDEADIGRTTFYANFDTKEDLLDQMCSEIFEHVFSEAKVKEPGHDFSKMPETLEGDLAHLLCHLSEHRGDIAGLLAGGSSGVFLRHFRSGLEENLERVPELFPDSVPKEYAEEFCLSSLSAFVLRWARGGFKEDPLDLAHWWTVMARGGAR